MSDIDEVIARTLGIDVIRITDDLTYQDIAEWDSLGHVSLMVALEDAYEVTIDDEIMVSLRTVRDIHQFLAGGGPEFTPSPPVAATIRRGLEGVVLDRTTITSVDGVAGTLEYRGYGIDDLARHASFDEVAYLLIFGELPDAVSGREFNDSMAARRPLPGTVLRLVHALREVEPMDALRACVASLAPAESGHSTGGRDAYSDAVDRGMSLLAQIPMIIAAHHAFRSGREPLIPDADVPHAHAFLTALLGQSPAPEHVKMFDTAMILHADNGSNASALSARIAMSCRAGMDAAITAAVATFGGSIHGGAAAGVMRLLDEVGDPDNAEEYVADRTARNQPVMGFGHRVYKTRDPRVSHLRNAVVELSQQSGDIRGLQILDGVAAAMHRYRRHGVTPNVDLYTGLTYRLLGLPDDLVVPLFAAGRVAGLVAHALEQLSNNVLIRPLLHYSGHRLRAYPPRYEVLV